MFHQNMFLLANRHVSSGFCLHECVKVPWANHVSMSCSDPCIPHDLQIVEFDKRHMMNFHTFLEKLEYNTLSRKQKAKVAKQLMLKCIQCMITVIKKKKIKCSISHDFRLNFAAAKIQNIIPVLKFIFYYPCQLVWFLNNNIDLLFCSQVWSRLTPAEPSNQRIWREIVNCWVSYPGWFCCMLLTLDSHPNQSISVSQPGNETL